MTPRHSRQDKLMHFSELEGCKNVLRKTGRQQILPVPNNYQRQIEPWLSEAPARLFSSAFKRI